MGFDVASLPVIEQPATAYCVVTASHRYNLPVEGLLSILMTEGGKPGMASPNKDGSFDLGVMQINTVWLKPRSPLYGYVSAETLKNDLCVNIHAAAWILAVQMKKVGDIWHAVGKYHAPNNPTLAWGYMNRVNKKLSSARQLIQTHPVYRQNIQALFTNAGAFSRTETSSSSSPKVEVSSSDFRAYFPAQ